MTAYPIGVLVCALLSHCFISVSIPFLSLSFVPCVSRRYRDVSRVEMHQKMLECTE